MNAHLLIRALKLNDRFHFPEDMDGSQIKQKIQLHHTLIKFKIIF